MNGTISRCTTPGSSPSRSRTRLQTSAVQRLFATHTELVYAALESTVRAQVLQLEAERLGVLAFEEAQRQHAHADQVGAVDALEAARHDSAHA